MCATHTLWRGSTASNRLIQLRPGASVAIRKPLTKETLNAATRSQCRMIVP